MLFCMCMRLTWKPKRLDGETQFADHYIWLHFLRHIWLFSEIKQSDVNLLRNRIATFQLM